MCEQLQLKIDEETLNSKEMFCKQLEQQKLAHRVLEEGYNDISSKLDQWTAALSATVESNRQNLAQAIQTNDSHYMQQLELLSERTDRKQAHCIELLATLEQLVVDKHCLLDSRADGISRSVELHHEHFTELYATLDEKFVAQVANLRKSFDTSQQEIRGTWKRIESSSVQQAAVQTSRMDQLTNLVMEHHAHFTDVLSTVVGNFADRHCTHEESAERLYKQVTDVCADMEHTLSDRINIQQQLLNASCTALSKKFAARIQTQDERLQSLSDAITQNHHYAISLCKSVEQEGVVSAEATTQKMEKMRAYFTDAFAGLNQKMTENMTADNKITSQLNATVDDHYRHFTLVFDRLHTDLTEKIATTNCRSDQRTEELHTRCAELDARFTSDLAVHAAKMNQLKESTTGDRSQLDAILSELEVKVLEAEAYIQEHVPQIKTYISETCGSLKAEVAEVGAAREERYERHHAHLADCLSKLDSQLQFRDRQQRERVNELSSSMEDNYREWVDQSNSANASLNQQIQTHRDGLESLRLDVDSDRSRLANSVDALETLFMDYRAQQDESVAKLQTTFADSTALLKSSLSDGKGRTVTVKHILQTVAEANEKQDLRHDALAAVVQQQHDHFTHVCAQLVSEDGQRHIALEERVERHHTQISGGLEALEHKFTATKAAQDQVVASSINQLMELRKSLHAELADQTHALSAGLNATLASIDDKFTGKLIIQDERIDEHHQQVKPITGEIDRKHVSTSTNLQDQIADVLSELERKITAAEIAHAARADEHYLHFQKTCNDLKVATTKATAEVNQKALDLTSNLAERLDQQCVSIRTIGHDLQEASSVLSRELAEGLSSQSAETENVQTHFASLVSKVEARIAEDKSDLVGRLDAEHQHLATAMASLEVKVDESIAVLRQQVSEEEAASCAKMARQIVAIDLQVEKFQSALLVKCDSLETMMTSEIHRIDSAVADSRSSQQTLTASMEKKSLSVKEKHREDLSALDDRLTAKSDSLQQQFENQHKHFTAVCSQLDTNVSSISSAFASNLSQSDASHKSRIDEIADALKQWKIDCVQMCDKVEKNNSENLVAERVRMEEFYSHFSNIVSRLQSKHAEESNARDRLIEDRYAAIMSLCQTVDAKFTEVNSNLDTLFSDTCSRLKVQLEDDIAQTAARMHSEHQHFTDVCFNINARIDTTVAEMSTQLAHLVGRLDQKLSAHNTELDDRIAAHYRYHTEVSRELDKDLSAKYVQQQSRIDQLAVQSNESVQALQISMKEHGAHFSQLFNDLDSQARHRLEHLDQLVDERHKQFTSLAANLDSKFSNQLLAQDERINDGFNHFTSLCANTRCSVEAECETVMERLTDVHDQLESRFAERDSAQDRRTELEHQNLTEAVGNLDRKVVDAVAEIVSQLQLYRHNSLRVVIKRLRVVIRTRSLLARSRR